MNRFTKEMANVSLLTVSMVRVCVLLLACLTGCAAAVPRPRAEPSVVANDGWIHAAPVGQYETWAFATLLNQGAADAIVEVRCADADSVVLRAGMSTDAGRRVRSVASIPLPGHAELKMTPDTWFFALIGLHHALLPGQRISVTIRLTSGASLPLLLRVTDAEGDPADGGN